MLGRLQDPKGLLSLSLPSSAIAAANHEVLEETSEGSILEARCSYCTGDTPEERYEIGRYASEHSKAAR